MEKKPSIQLICVGPVIDLYGRFAAEKLARLMEMYPDRVFSKPEFTALPPYLFSGADFALIPSRDEPFGLVAVEFGRKGALGVGSRLGGLGLMPGWVSDALKMAQVSLTELTQLLYSGSLWNPPLRNTCCLNWPAPSKWLSSPRKKNVNCCAPVRRFNVSPLWNGVNALKISTAVLSPLVDRSLEPKPGGRLMENPDHSDLSPITMTGTLYTKPTLRNLIGTNRAT
jgi:hypothetical protein